jgi:hypothetical protein
MRADQIKFVRIRSNSCGSDQIRADQIKMRADQIKMRVDQIKMRADQIIIKDFCGKLWRFNVKTLNTH